MDESIVVFVFFFQAEDGIRDVAVTGVQTCALPICGLEVQLLVRLAGDRVFYDGRPGPRKPGPGRNGVHGQRFELAAPVRERGPDQQLIVPDTSRYGRVEVR